MNDESDTPMKDARNRGYIRLYSLIGRLTDGRNTTEPGRCVRERSRA